jgi:peptide/nickel transport system ATP-binding protein
MTESAAADGAILVARKLVKHFPINQSTVLKRKTVVVKAVDGIDFSVRQGECLGLVGESGSGKSTTAYTVVGTYPPTSGTLLFRGQNIAKRAVDRPLSLKKDIQIVFQDPGSSLNPRRSVGDILSMPLHVHQMVPRGQSVEKRIIELLDLVELPAAYRFKYPATIGGGERQMVAIARALATNPSLIILDEPTSALDVSVQGKIINMLLRLQKELHLTYLFITHDLSLMRNVATRIAIMYLGKIAEVAPAADFFEKPLHPYTQMLLSSIPVLSDSEEAMKPKKVHSAGEIPSPVDVPPGCSFNTRCPFKIDRCLVEDPVMRAFGPEHFARCHVLQEVPNHAEHT